MDGANENAGRAGKYLIYWPIQESRGEILVAKPCFWALLYVV